MAFMVKNIILAYNHHDAVASQRKSKLDRGCALSASHKHEVSCFLSLVSSFLSLVYPASSFAAAENGLNIRFNATFLEIPRCIPAGAQANLWYKPGSNAVR